MSCVQVFDIDVTSPTFGSVISVFNYRTAMPAAKILDGPPHGRELCEIALSPVDHNVVLLNIKRTNLVRYNIASRDAKLVDVKTLNVTNKTFLFGATFSYNGKVLCVIFNLLLKHVTCTPRAGSMVVRIDLVRYLADVIQGD